MSEPSPDDVLGKLDALMKRHQPPADADVPVLTELVAPPEIDLDAIPLLTEEIAAPPSPAPAPTEPEAIPPLPELEPLAFELPAAAPEAAHAALEFDFPPGARYVPLPSIEEEVHAATVAEMPTAVETSPTAESAPAPAPTPSTAVHALSEETIQLIADTLKADVAKILDAQLQRALAQQLQSSLHVALDRALSSMLDQFVIHIEEVVKLSIASELKKQLAEFRPTDQP